MGCDMIPTPENDAKRAVKDAMVDPSSAVFGTVFSGSKPGNFCGEVDGKNRMGGFAGKQHFSYEKIDGTDVGMVRWHGDVATRSDFQMLKDMAYREPWYSEVSEKCDHPKFWLKVCGTPYHEPSIGFCDLMTNPKTLVDVLNQNFD